MKSAGTLPGVVLGWILGPVFGVMGLVRGARPLHPSGSTFRATVSVHSQTPLDLRALGGRLAGPALVRFSGAIWKANETWPDVLGCAIRLQTDEHDGAEASAEDQDVLFATIQRPWTMPLAPFTTDVRDYLGNDYLGVSPFDVGLDREVYLRLHPDHPCQAAEGTRTERLAREVGDVARRASLTLGVSEGPYGPWVPVASVAILRPAHVDGEALRFHPFRQGRGVRPRGFIQGLRRGVYAFSQATRPRHQRI
jgi:hypothetical protein